MLARYGVLQNSPPAAYPSRLLPYKQPISLNPLESTLPQVFILNNLKSFRINTYVKRRGELSPAFRHACPSLLQRKHAALSRDAASALLRVKPLGYNPLLR